jgi:alanine racemase
MCLYGGIAQIMELHIEKALLKKNVSAVNARLSGAHILAVLKSDAYGLGLLPMARFWRDEGVRRFGVGSPADGAKLRAEGFTQEEIILLRSTADPKEINIMLDNNIIAAIGSQEAALALSGIAESRSAVAEAHIEIDCGLGRYGFLPGEIDKILSIFSYMQNIAVSGVCTHIPGGVGRKKALACTQAFDGVLAALREKNVETGVVHALGSTALFRYPKLPRYDVVRVGAAMTGRIPGRTGLAKVGVINALITDVRWIPAGNPVAGGGKKRKAVRIGLIPVGYAAGFMAGRPACSRTFLQRFTHRNKARVILGLKEEAVLLGLIGQNHIVVDLTRSDAAIGTMARVEVDPLFAGALPRRIL